MATTLVTGVGGVGGISALQSILDNTTHEVIGVDMDPDADGFYLLDRGRVVPPADDDRWVQEMVDVVKEFDVDVVVPLVDEELARASELRNELPESVAVLAPRTDVINRTLDKYRMAKTFDEHGLSVPETRLATEAEELTPADFPLVVKPRRGRGSRGIKRVDSAEALRTHLREEDREREDLVLQEYVSGVEYTTSVVATRDNELLGIVPKEAIAKRGCTVRGATRLAPSVVSSCRRIFDAVRPHGPMNVQQIVSDGDVYTIEVNPRFSSTACLTVEAGVDEFDLLIREAVGESVSPPGEYVADLHIVRYTAHTFVPEGELGTQKSRNPEAARDTTLRDSS